jgi:hypothetical protein
MINLLFKMIDFSVVHLDKKSPKLAVCRRRGKYQSPEAKAEGKIS